MEQKKLRVGIIGVGSISEVHIAGYQADPRAEIVAFCDINEELLKKKGEKYGVTNLFTDVNEMVKMEDLDAVSVCTWNAAHAPCTIAALNAGKHVLCEKPMAMSVAEAQAMHEAAQRNGKLLMIGFVRRFGSDTAMVQDFIDQGFFGDFYYAKATYLRRNGNPGGWLGDTKRSGGGPLIDLGVHVIDLVRYLMGNPKPVSVYGATFQKLLNRPNIKKAPGQYVSAGASDNDVCDVEDLASVMIRFDNGAVLSVEASFSLNIKTDEGKVQLFGTKGGAKLESDLELYGEMGGYMTNTTLASGSGSDFNGLFEREMNHFVSCVLDGTPCRAPAEDGVTLMRILESAYESARTGHEVVINN